MQAVVGMSDWGMDAARVMRWRLWVAAEREW